MGEHFEGGNDETPRNPEKPAETPNPMEGLEVARKEGDAREIFAGSIMTVNTFLTPENKVDAAKVESVKAAVPSNLLEQLNQLQPGLLFDLYVKERDGMFEVDFYGNADADQHIGLSQLFRGNSKKTPMALESIRTIKILEADGQEHRAEQTGVRGNFYETVGSHRVYQEIHQGYRFAVLTTDEQYKEKLEQKNATAKTFYEKLVTQKDYFKDTSWSELSGSHLTWNEETGGYVYDQAPRLESMTQYVIREAVYQDVDPQLAMSVVKASLTGPAPDDFETKLQWTLRGLKEYESHYGAEHGGNNGKDAEGAYTAEFLAGLMEFPVALDLPEVQSFFTAYGTLVGKVITVPTSFQEHSHDEQWKEIETAQGEGIRALVPYANRISSHYGFRKRPKTKSGWGSSQHKGIDISAPSGSPIRAYAKGKVTAVVQGHDTAGNYIEIQHPNGLSTRYLHCDTTGVKKGQSVEKGALIATVGTTGNSSGPHLHFEVRRLGIALNPERYL